MEQHTSLNFSIEGEFIANLARTRLKEGNYLHALSILECLDGITMESQVSILKGQETLTGVNDIDIVPAPLEIQKDMEEWHRSKYSSIFLYENKFYVPYAYVTSWAQEDLPKRDTLFSHVSTKIIDQYEPELITKMYDKGYEGYLKSHPHSRCLFYEVDPFKHFAISVTTQKVPNFSTHNKAVVLFKETTEQMPFWTKDYYAKDPYTAISNFIKEGHYLEETGASSLFNNWQEDFSEVTTPKAINPLTEKMLQADEEYWAEQDALNERYKQQVIDFANNDKEYGWKEFSNENGSIKVPYRAFLHYAVNRKDIINNVNVIDLPEYTPIFPSGIKMSNDNAYHTDCWVGAGLDLDKAYDYDSWQYKLFTEKMFEAQSDFHEKRDFNVINGSKKLITGTTVNPSNYESVPKGDRILVIPNLSEQFTVAAMNCDAIITETGGKLAHLAIVGREMSIPIIRIEDAVIRYALPLEYEIDILEGTINKAQKIKKFRP